MGTYLVVADRTAWSMGLARKLGAFAQADDPAEFVLVVPAEPALEVNESQAVRDAQEAAARARTSLRVQGLTVLDALAGPALPRKALEEEMNRGLRNYGAIIIGVSRRNPDLQIQPSLAGQLERRYGIPVHLISLQSAVMTWKRSAAAG